MCGIAGFVDGETADRRHRLHRMTAALRHRGPDDDGHFLDEVAGLGMTRLAIIDLDGGSQPKSSRGGALQTVFNGEIYNYRALKKELQGHGHLFESDSDSEVVARAFEEWGAEAFSRMHGMFAIAVWDRSSQRLTLARDRIGKKPLYLWPRGRWLSFASELKALAAVGPWPGIDERAFAEYLHLGFVPTPRSIWSGISKLPAGHVAQWEDGRLRSWPFWELERDRPALDPVDPVPELDRRIHRAVGCRLVADVDVGVLLSGGIDSSLVAATAAEQHPGVNTFTVAFEDPSLDESGPARALASALGTTHHETRATDADALALVQDLPGIFDEPFADPSSIPTLLISRFAAEHVKVVLGGDGGDELFSGYERYQRFGRMLRLQEILPQPARRLGRHLLPSSHRVVRQAGTLLDRWGDTPAATYWNVIAITSPSDLRRLLAHPEAAPTVPASFVDAFAAPLDRAPRYADLSVYLPDGVLAKVDRASMSTGLEVRAPFLDTELVEWATRLGPRCLGAPGAKALPRALLAKRFPELSRRPKQGFGGPVDQWLKGPLKPLVQDLLAPSTLAEHGLLQATAVERLVGGMDTIGPAVAPPVWALLMFQLWYERWSSPR
ncbi:MAG: Asparagine synthetase [glutamine-hydrolyzing] [uncultured Acidimicrobiales bacterium]|uniref:asparagine synthase (glutamine-hydrolyzing) n=1 Tax=uncultured Acidimicrobiales bacterium TaxID=310071 RepID=A0A6J4H4J3_9ACTN|nr:MAG: Asparagine synthetase [glutamine-hydrolyzing] [uncultured Acidimicrobiales bacterium]